MNQRVRTPVAALVDDRGVTLVICDDGSTWFLGFTPPAGWHRLPPIPGTIEAQIQAQSVEPAGCTEARD